MTRPSYRMILFVADSEPHSVAARRNLDALCREELNGDFELEIIDVMQDASVALFHRVPVTPCLVVLDPPPKILVAGTLSDREKIRVALRIPAHPLP